MQSPVKRTVGSGLSPFIPSVVFLCTLLGQPAPAANRLSETITRTPTNGPGYEIKLSQDIYNTWYTDDPYYVDVPYEEEESYWENVPYERQEWVCDLVEAMKVPSPGAECDRSSGCPDLPNPPPPEPPAPPPPRPPEPPAPPQPPQPVCRWETRTEWRQEQRTRTVTKYRREERCCERNEHTAFDHTWNQPVQLNFPKEPALLPGESEKITVSLEGTESRPEIGIDSSKGIFHYKISRSSLLSGKLVVDLEFTPHLGEAEAGKDSIGELILEIGPQGAEIVLRDKLRHPRVSSRFSAKLLLRPEGSVIGEAPELTKGSDGAYRAKLAGSFDPDKDFAVQLGVAREGIVLKEKLGFELTREFPAEKIDKAKLADKARIDKFSWPGELESSAIRFVDATPVYKTVKTSYTVRIWSMQGKLLADGTVSRGELRSDNYGRLLIPVRSLGASRQAMSQMTDGTKMKVEFIATRKSNRFQPIVLKKSGEMIVGHSVAR